MQRAFIVAAWTLGSFAAFACTEELPPIPVIPQNGSGGAGGAGGSSSGPAGGAMEESVGGFAPAPMFELECGAESCVEGQVCCLDVGVPTGCGDLAACLGVPLACDDEDDCNAGGGEPEVCCAIFEAGTFDRTECTHKGGCSANGYNVVCKGTDDCESCVAATGLPAGWQTCGPTTTM